MMKVPQPKIVSVGSNEQPSVMLTLSEWEDILEELEELEDIRAYDNAKSASQDKIPFSQAVREIQQDYN